MIKAYFKTLGLLLTFVGFCILFVGSLGVSAHLAIEKGNPWWLAAWFFGVMLIAPFFAMNRRL